MEACKPYYRSYVRLLCALKYGSSIKTAKLHFRRALSGISHVKIEISPPESLKYALKVRFWMHEIRRV